MIIIDSYLNAVLTIFIRFLVCFNSLTTSTHTHTDINNKRRGQREKGGANRKTERGEGGLYCPSNVDIDSMFTRSVVCGWWCVVVVYLPEY